MKTVTLAMEWREDEDGYMKLFIGELDAGWISVSHMRSPDGKIARVIADFTDDFDGEEHETREAAMEALEAAVLAMGVKE
jgi:hypothetical protein